MQAGKILPGFRLLFSQTKSAKGAQKDPNPGQQGGYGSDREPTEKEVLEAKDILNNSEDFKKNGLEARLVSAKGIFYLEVVNSSGTALKTIRGAEIFSLLISNSQPGLSRQGRILDRRV